MLSTKLVKIHGMKDDNWTIKDKLQQYRGVLKLHAREKKLQSANLITWKKKVSRDLNALSKDVREYRGVLNDITTGDKRRISTLFQDHKDLLLALIDLPPSEILTGVCQDGSLKRRQLDKVYYQKKQMMKKFFELKRNVDKQLNTFSGALIENCSHWVMSMSITLMYRYITALSLNSNKCATDAQSLVPTEFNYGNYMMKLEYTLLLNKIELEDDPSDKKQQNLITRYQRSMARHNAAQSIQTTYELMLNILKKDAIYFDAVLEALKKDQKEQCKVIYKVAVMGQLVTEDLDDNREKYKHMAREVWVNMKERERTLKITRAQVEDIWAYAQSLVRVQSDTDMVDKIKETPKFYGELESQIRSLEEIFDKVKECLHVRSFRDLHSRLEEQSVQKDRLSKQFELALKERDSFLKKKQHAELILSTLENSMLSTSGQYKKDKKTMLEETKAQQKRQKDCKETRKVRGKLLMNIRAALQNMADMLIMIEDKSEKKVPMDEEMDNTNKSTEKEKLVIELQVAETDALALLTQVTQKAALLLSISNFQLDSEKEERARELYQTYVSDYKSNLKFGDEESEPSGIFVEHEIIDPSILSRKDIKKRSKQIVDAHLKED